MTFFFCFFFFNFRLYLFEPRLKNMFSLIAFAVSRAKSVFFAHVLILIRRLSIRGVDCVYG